MQTLTGIHVTKIWEEIDKPLPPEAYRALTGGKGQTLGLTDISLAHWMDQISAVFGPRGVGWNVIEKEISTCPTTDRRGNQITLSVAKMEMSFLWLDGESRVLSGAIPGYGAHADENPDWALNGAVTSAIKSCFKGLGSQRSVWKGERSHDNPGSVEEPPAAPPPASPPKEPINTSQLKRLKGLVKPFVEAARPCALEGLPRDVEMRRREMAFYSRIAGRNIESASDLTAIEAGACITWLERRAGVEQ